MVTVLMPTYNCALYISDAIRSILNQTYKEFEFLIIDDGSTDNTEQIISDFKDNRIKYFKKENTGLADSLNYGLKLAKHDIIARMDADDIAHPRRLEKQLAYLSIHKAVDILSCWSAFFSERRIIYTIKAPLNHEEIKNGLLLYSYIPHSGCLYSRNIILDNGGYKGGVFEDYHLWLRLMDKAKFANIPEILIFQRYRKNSLSRENLREKHKIIYPIQEPYYNDLEKHFSIHNKEDELVYKGWREYFYGTPELARQYWSAGTRIFFKDYRIVLAYMISFLPVTLFIKFKETRMKYRLQYLLNYFAAENRATRRTFRSLL